FRASLAAAGCVAIVAFDVLASIASRVLGFPYSRASVGSYFIYLAIGFIAARAAESDRAKTGAATAAVAGLAEASIGWAASWALGPGQWVGQVLTPTRWAITD